MPKSLRRNGAKARLLDAAQDETAPAKSPATERARPAKHHAITRAAAETFLAEGFERASLDQIAYRAGVSKQTIYSHFADKEALFKAICTNLTETLTAPLQLNAPAADLRAALIRLGEDMLKLMLRPASLDLHRLVVSAAPRFPELGRVAYEAGAKRMSDAIAALLVERARLGRDIARPLAPAEAQRLAEQFVGMLRGLHQLRGLLGVKPMPAGQRKAYVAACVDTLLGAL
ncbi:TetR/AcrR family transcriptional regulator [Hyphomicrobiales bacterium]|nr:TetR/AcrR family transcriptional regulator [Hyphomicrobiales bacterium]CAH1697415.1 TetR/AcrR family transcriptional regulator [Hyphomicrobiales bacterium]CAI0345603.1 TetR/AcrR family transcriptional regulator, mexJK operon transcriptional repressor [Hyphomicrobiales bacterium]